jgi:predicted transcriptional regulator
MKDITVAVSDALYARLVVLASKQHRTISDVLISAARWQLTRSPQALGRLGGLARARSHTREQLSAIGKRAVATRWQRARETTR